GVITHYDPQRIGSIRGWTQCDALLYGLYDTRDQAVSAIDSLPTRAKLMAPWPRTVQSIKDLVK
ncbi:MAG: hypothetical protein AAF419_03035, partial [Pseudomonadota bacterium]